MLVSLPTQALGRKMQTKPKLLAFAGSAREDSYNKKLIRIAAACASDAGADVTLIDFRDYPIPLYDGDLEEREGLPKNALEIKTLMRGHEGFLISAPEYNSSITPLMKNTIDWASRKESPDEPPFDCFRGKTGALLSASPGRFGGMRGLVVLRALLSHTGVTLLPEQFCLPLAASAFDDEGQLRDESMLDRTRAIAKHLVDFTRRVSA